MKQTKFIACLGLVFLMTQSLVLGGPQEESEFINSIQDAFKNHSAESLVALTFWTGVSEEDKKSAIKKYEQEVALNMTRVEFKEAESKYWKNWKKGDIEFTYNLPVTKEMIVHLEEGSTVTLSFGEVPIKDIKIPVGEKDGKWYLLKSVEVTDK